jgi:hypothetical protein
MFGSHKKKLYQDGAETEGLVIKCWTEDVKARDINIRVRVKFPDDSVTEIVQRGLMAPIVGDLYQGSVVPVRYDPTDHSKAVVDLPALKERQSQADAAQQAQLEQQFAHLGERGTQSASGPAAALLAGLADGGDLKAQILRQAAQNPGSVIDLRSSPPPGDQPSDPVERLSKLAELKQQGVLTDEEFTAAKAEILGES